MTTICALPARNLGVTLDTDLIARIYRHTMDDEDPTLMHEAAYEIARLRAVLAMCGSLCSCRVGDAL